MRNRLFYMHKCTDCASPVEAWKLRRDKGESAHSRGVRMVGQRLTVGTWEEEL